MRVTVEYFGAAREAAGLAREAIEYDPPCPAAELVARVARNRGGRLAQLLLADNRLSPSVLVAVGDRQVTADDRVLLRDGDEITVIPPISGGAR
ncbi:MAG TPA: MoaD/ThiS family protein [Gemmataceae bacterium]|nr:MoaD/ThiS family protein [Gemmataceae bacterium]